ncbi:MAG TPA: prepilin-type N-terminal cleavage/methylation domain-containing protein [Gemmatimonadaceae bacterium]|nr:prepilin-type N-terminal cleavage/methylation domain-containing protein [Gemmatimonadaceae bacterium]
MIRRSTSRQPRRFGFTMMEIIIVLMLTGIIAALAYPKIDVGRYKADSVVTTVRSVMQQAQRASLVSQHDVIVSFDLTGHRIRVVWDANNDHLLGFGERSTWTSLTSGNRFGLPQAGVRGGVTQPVTGSNVRMLDGMPTVTFHRDGSLSSDLEIYMSTIASPTRWRAVTVIQATGRTDWYRKGVKDANWVAGVL